MAAVGQNAQDVRAGVNPKQALRPLNDNVLSLARSLLC